MVLLGALCAANLRRWGREGRLESPRSAAAQYAAALRVLAALARAQQTSRPLVPVRELPGLDAYPSSFVDELARLLADLGYMHRLCRVGERLQADESDFASTEEYWLLAQPASGLSVRPLFEALWNNALVQSPELPGGGSDRCLSLDTGLFDCGLDQLAIRLSHSGQDSAGSLQAASRRS
jgi:hypothetical protein